MANNADNLVLEMLRAIRTDISTLRRDMRDIKSRLSGIESHMTGYQIESSRHSTCLDELDERVQRIEQRLELRDAD
jgi:hypothetical protein